MPLARNSCFRHLFSTQASRLLLLLTSASSKQLPHTGNVSRIQRRECNANAPRPRTSALIAPYQEMNTLETCPHDLLYLIFQDACHDTGVTARSLALTSRRMSAISSTFRYRNLAIIGITRIKRAYESLLSVPEDLRRVHHLYLADIPSEYLHVEPVSPNMRLRGCTGTEKAKRFQLAVDKLLALVAPTLRTLTCVTRNPWQRFILAHMGTTTFPCLESLSLSQTTRMPFHSDAFLPPSPLRMPKLRRLHLAYTGAGYIDFRVGGIVRLFADHCPNLTQLRLSDIDFYLGGKAELFRMLHEMRIPTTEIFPLEGSPISRQLAIGGRMLQYPSHIQRVIVQLQKRGRYGAGDLEAEDMKVLRSMQCLDRDEFMLDNPRISRTYDEWVDEWLEVSDGNFDAWEDPERHSRLTSVSRRSQSCA
ncbi:unnamed protein product [Peniophora sp. CBMAI 1063]|nr:unnamed protein product [Peniophora sp. CBMAI 1063]